MGMMHRHTGVCGMHSVFLRHHDRETQRAHFKQLETAQVQDYRRRFAWVKQQSRKEQQDEGAGA